MEEKVISYLEELSNKTLLTMWNEYCQEECYDDYIYNIEEFDEIMQNEDPYDIARQVYYGDFCPVCDYFKFNGYGNLKSIDEFELQEYIYLSDLADYIIRNDYDFNDLDLREILDNEEEN